MSDMHEKPLPADEARRQIAELEARAAHLQSRLAELEGRNQILEQELRPFMVLADNIPDNIYFKDMDLRYRWVNRNMFALRGLSKREDLIGKTSFDVHPKELAQQSFNDDQRVVRTGEYLLNKLETDRYADGSPMWVLTTKIPLRDAEGKIIGLCGISKDFTKMVQAEQVLAKEGALRNDLLENIPDGVWFKDKDSRFTWINKSIINDFGKRDKAEIIGKGDPDFFTEAHAREARADELRIMETGQALVNKLEQDNYGDGSPRWVYTTKIPVHDVQGNVIGTCGITRDVTALKKAEDALALESNLLNVMLNNIPDAIYFKDTESRFVRVSRGIHLEGIQDLAEAIGKTDFDFFTKDHAKQAFDDEQEIMRTGEPIVDKVERETFNTGRPDAWVSTTKVPIYGKDGKISGIVGISRDVTERMAAQEAIKKAKEDLEVRVQERTAALVQEIKEHLRTERALRDGERLLQEANSRLESRVGQLHYLNAAAHRLAHFTHRRDLLPAIVETFARSYPGIEAAICELGNAGYECAVGSPRLADPEHRKSCAAALAPQGLVRLGTPVLIADRGRDPELSAIVWTGMENLPVYLALPLLVEERSLAVVQIFAPESFLAWFDQEKVILNTLGAQAAISLSNANNFHELEKKARLESELEVAQAIQRRFTPQDKPMIPRVNLKGVYYPAYEVGGDYLDYFQTDDGNWVVVIADVSGKGIPAALVMTMLRSTFRAEARYEKSAKNLMCAVNELMLADLDDMSFVTALCLIIDKEGKTMSYARAGHPPLLMRHGNNGAKSISLNPKGLALGMVGGKDFSDRLEEQTVELASGDRILIFTDGLLEAMDADRKFYGLTRLLNLLDTDRVRDPEKVLKRILDDVRIFTRSEPYHDDLTMLAMEITG